MATAEDVAGAVGELSIAEVGVVIPAYNMEAWIRQAISSVLDQGIPVEIVVVDDASPDRSAEIAQEVLRDFASGKVITNDRIRGVCGARNAGLNQLSTPWVLFLDADDFLRPGALQALLAGRRPGRVAVLGAFGTVGEDGQEREGSWSEQRDEAMSKLGQASSLTVSQLARANVMPPPGAQLLSAAALRGVHGFDEGPLAQGWSEDAELLARLAAKGSVGLVDEEVLAYRVRNGSLSTRPGWRRQVTRSRLLSLRRAPRLARPAMGWAFGGRYASLAKRRLADGFRRGHLGPIVNALANLVLAFAFVSSGVFLLPLPTWRASWSLDEAQ